MAVTIFKKRPQVALRRDGSLQGRSSHLHCRLLSRYRQLRVQLQRGGHAVRIHESGEASSGPSRLAGLALHEGGLRAGQALPEKASKQVERS